MKVSIGIDVGQNGAYAIFVDNKLSYGKIPSIEGELNMQALQETIYDAFVPQLKENPETELELHCVIEDLHSVFNSSAKSNFAFGLNNGLIIGMLQCAELPYTKVSPKKWQKEMWQGIRPVEIPTKEKNKDGSIKYKVDTKATSLIAVKRLFPSESFLATERSKVPHDGIVDAVLMADYCRRNFK